MHLEMILVLLPPSDAAAVHTSETAAIGHVSPHYIHEHCPRAEMAYYINTKDYEKTAVTLKNK